MNTEELAKLLNGREYRNEMTQEEEKLAKESNLVVIFGASDDLMEARGAVNEEWGAGETAFFTGSGVIVNECESEDCPHFEKLVKDAKFVYPQWDNEGYSFTYRTNINHSTFDILEDGEKYCRGIVFSLFSMPPY
jgi:hypothetical protein